MILVEDTFYGISEIVEESENKVKKRYLKGVFMEAELKNRNGRIYDRDELAREVEKVNNMAAQGRYMLGENGHPPGRLEVDIERASHKIVEMEMVGNQAIGKSEILVETPSGKILEGLIKSGINIGVSSRGTGTLNESTGKVKNFNLYTIDTVLQPSAINAYPMSVLESFNMYRNGSRLEDAALSVINDKAAQRYFETELKRFIESLRV